MKRFSLLGTLVLIVMVSGAEIAEAQRPVSGYPGSGYTSISGGRRQNTFEQLNSSQNESPQPVQASTQPRFPFLSNAGFSSFSSTGFLWSMFVGY